jgi:signal transduction histidine kinase
LIDRGLRRLGEALAIDRSSFAEFDLHGRAMLITHSYVADGVPELPREIVDDQFPWYARQIRLGRPVRVERIPEELPDEAVKERTYCIAVGMKSNLAIPLSVDDRFGCVLTFATFRDHLVWSDELVDRLWLLGEIFANAIARRRLDETTQKLREQLMRIARVTLVGELAAAIVHEVNQPLCAILANSRAGHRLAEAGNASAEELAEIFSDIASAGRRASEFVDRIRRLIQNRPPQLESVSLSDAIDEVVSLLAGLTASRGVTLRKRVDGSMPALVCDRIQLQQVLLNLVLNAIDAVQGSQKRIVEIEASTSLGPNGRQEACVAVRDTGPGIPPEIVESIFQPFFTTKPNGIGAGLSICRSIVQSHGGRIFAESSPGSGATLRFILPHNEIAI